MASLHAQRCASTEGPKPPGSRTVSLHWAEPKLFSGVWRVRRGVRRLQKRVLDLQGLEPAMDVDGVGWCKSQHQPTL